MTTVNKNWTFDDLVTEYDYEQTREEWVSLCAKGQLLSEMISELYAKKDFESDTFNFLDKKRDVIREQRYKFYDIQEYLYRLKEGLPFHVSTRVGRQMVKHGLTKNQGELFLSVHKSHRAAMGSENQRKYALHNVRNVVWNIEEDCLHVHFDDVWWHYDKRGCWW